MTPAHFDRALQFFTTYYHPVRLQDVLEGRGLPARPILLTFDDGYASDRQYAAPVCRRYGIPAVFFINAAHLDNHSLAPDNLVCYAFNVLGLGVINQAAKAIRQGALELESLADVFSSFLPSISLEERRRFLDLLAALGRLDVRRLAAEAGLYLSRTDVSALAGAGFAIGNHTYSHVHCRVLGPQSFGEEIDRNLTELEGLAGVGVRAFSVPYGSAGDLTSDLARHLRISGYGAVFLSESVANARRADRFCLNRVSVQANRDDQLFFETEVMPRLRAVRSKLTGGHPHLSSSAPRVAAMPRDGAETGA